MPDTAQRSETVGHDKYERLIKSARSEIPVKVAVVHPCDDVSLEGVIEAARLHLIEPVQTLMKGSLHTDELMGAVVSRARTDHWRTVGWTSRTRQCNQSRSGVAPVRRKSASASIP
jgi:hypothetical protein